MATRHGSSDVQSESPPTPSPRSLATIITIDSGPRRPRRGAFEWFALAMCLALLGLAGLVVYETWGGGFLWQVLGVLIGWLCLSFALGSLIASRPR